MLACNNRLHLLCLIRAPGREQNGRDTIYEEIMSGNFLKLMGDVNSQIQGVQARVIKK